MKTLVIYVHGKGGSVKEAKHYQSLFAEIDVIGFDYKSQNPWEAKIEFSQFFDLHSKGYDSVILIANSIGAFLSMYTLAKKKISQALFISPIVNMEKLITDMMMWANVTEDELQSKKEIPTAFGENLSWEYLCYVRKHPIKWSIPTCILYGGQDNLTSIETISEFTNRILFETTDILRIYAEPFAYNIGSRWGLEKAGFEFEGIMKNNAVKNGKVLDMALYSLTRNM